MTNRAARTLCGSALATLLTVAATSAQAQDHQHGASPAPAPAASPAPAATMDHGAMDHSQMDHGAMDHGAMDHSQMDHSQMGHAMPGTGEVVIADRRVPDFAEGSGTARLPGNEGAMHGLHLMPGDDWMVMLHGYAQANYTDHGGPRGDDKFYVTTMGMVDAQKDTGWGRFQLRSMFSLEPAMDSSGYPNLFATGETSRGEPLVDRQHPHDLFMELAARVDVDVAEGTSLFLYGGPVGEPALGPSAFMHRGSASLNPEPPITHHWFDSTHITYGVVTAGLSSPHWQLEASAFRGQEPDERRWNIETPKLDSWSARLTWNPTPAWAVQVSHGFIKQPEAQHPGEDEHRTTASVNYASADGFNAMLAFSAKNRDPGDTLTAWLGEVSYDLNQHHTVFGRVENVANDELFPDHADPLHDQRFRVTRFQAGYAYRLPLAGPFNLALGAAGDAYAKPSALDAAYGNNPLGYTLFARLSLGH